MAMPHGQLLMDLRVMLTSSLRLEEVLGSFYEELCRHVVGADGAAFCISIPGPVPAYDWHVKQLPTKPFADYLKIADQDFVLKSVMRNRNLVLSDQQMVTPAELRNSRFYARFRDLGTPLEHVMAVLLDFGADWHGGFTLYRAGRRPFSGRERIELQSLVPGLASTMRNSRLLAPMAGSKDLVEAIYRQREFECVVIQPPCTEMTRTPGATPLLQKWFQRLECDDSWLPIALLGQLKQLASIRGPTTLGDDTLFREHETRRLVMTCVPLPERDGRQFWAVVLQEESSIPREWRPLLTPRELDVLEGLLRDKSNKDILRQERTMKMNTLKTHLKRIFSALEVERRGEILLKAGALNARRRWGRRL